MTEIPSRARQKVLSLLCLMYMITYLARVVISVAAPVIMRQLSLSKVQMGIAFTAFVLPYAIFQLPTGLLGDKFGPRKVLASIVLLWSIFTGLTALAWNLASLVVFRFFFGICEAGAFPNATRAFFHWLPKNERALASGITHSSARVAGGLTPIIVVTIMAHWGWRAAFVAFSIVGVFWSIVWLLWFRDTPAGFRARGGDINDLEMALIEGDRASSGSRARVTISQVLRSRNLWFLGMSNFMYSFAFWIYLAWLPSYFVQARGMSMMSMGIMASLPMLAGAAGDAIGGWLSDLLLKKTKSPKWARRSVPIFGLTAAALLMTPGAIVHSPHAAVALLTAGMFGLEIAVGAYWAVCLDVGQDSAGAAAGMMSSLGNAGAAISPLLVGAIVQYTHSWVLSFAIASVLLLVGAVLWMFVDPGLPLEAELMLPQDSNWLPDPTSMHKSMSLSTQSPGENL